MTTFRCKSCEAAFDHPITTSDDEYTGHHPEQGSCASR